MAKTGTPRAMRAAERKALAKAAAAERTRLAAIATERAAEELAPRHARLAVTAIDGTVLRGSRVTIERGRPVPTNPAADLVGQRGEAVGPVADRTTLPRGYVYADTVGILASKGRVITREHVRAARRLQDDCREVGGGIGVRGVNYGTLALGRAGALRGGASEARHGAALAQIGTRERLDAALNHLRPLCDIVVPVALDCVPVAAWARDRNVDARQAIGYLAAALSMLAAFYDAWRLAVPATG